MENGKINIADSEIFETCPQGITHWAEVPPIENPFERELKKQGQILTFKNIEFDDFVGPSSDNEPTWTTVCNLHKNGLEDFVSGETSMDAVCGVRNCKENSAFYIDFYK